MRRLQELLDLIRQYGELPAIVDAGATYTYAELFAEHARWSVRLESMGIASGAVVGLRADYSFAAIALLLALMARRTVVALIPREGDIDGFVREACINELITIDSQGEVEKQKRGNPNVHPLLERIRVAGESGFVIFTSGSTGHPKAALQSVERFLCKYHKVGRRFRTLAFLMFDHIAGLDTLFYTLRNGGALVLTRSREPRAIVDLIETQSVEVLPASPSFLRLLCLSVGQSSSIPSSLRVITYGSEPMDATTLRLVNDRFPFAQISQKYGTTEVGSPKSVSRSNDSLWLRLVGQSAGSGVESKVIDGVLWIRSESTILGYLNAPSPVDADGWYCTGDLVDVDGEWLRFRGRASDLINVGGEKVSPAEVERVILELDFVRAAVVCAASHVLLGQVVVARVELSEASEPRDARTRIRAHCSAQLARYKVPVKIEFTAEVEISERHKKRRAPADNIELSADM